MNQRMGSRTVAIATVLGVLLAFVVGSIGSTVEPQSAPPTPNPLPNFVYIMADDQDLLFGSMDYMPFVQSYIGEEGIQFNNAFTTTPLCCPARASLLRGMYEHNHHMSDNTVNNVTCYTLFTEAHEDEETLATLLQQYGYTTGLVGKYLNGYVTENATYIPPGWDEWFALNENTMYDYYNSSVSNNSVVSYFNGSYQTDVLSNRATSWIQEVAQQSQPFFLLLTPLAPHEPSTPALRHNDLFPFLKAPRTPSWNESEVTQQFKPAWIRTLPIINATELAGGQEYEDLLMGLRIRALQAVDEMVATVVQTLEYMGVLNNTYVIYTSDNGFNLGQHRLVVGKKTNYEEDMRLPYYIRGPGIPAHTSRSEVVLNIDVAPTILELAGISAPDWMDGVSFAPLLTTNDTAIREYPSRSYFLVEGNYNGPYWLPNVNNTCHSIRFFNDTTNWQYSLWWDGSQEFYDIDTDPYELQNLINATTPIHTSWIEFGKTILPQMLSCAGQTCRDMGYKTMMA